MGIDTIRLAELSGIELPQELTAARQEAQDRLTRLRDRQAAIQRNAGVLPGDVEALRGSLREALLTSQDTAMLRKSLAEGAGLLAVIQVELQVLPRLIAQAEANLAKARKAVEDVARVALRGASQKMREQLRRGLGQPIAPEEQSRSRIVACEMCYQAISIFDWSTISLPLLGRMFSPLSGSGERGPFPPDQGLPAFKCPICKCPPWREPDRVLTNSGWFLVPPPPMTSAELKAELEGGEITVSAFAEALGVSQPFLSAVLAERKNFPEGRARTARKLLQNWPPQHSRPPEIGGGRTRNEALVTS